MALTSDYTVDENVLVQAVLESAYGTDPGSGYETIPVYRQFTPNSPSSDPIDLGEASVGSNPSNIGVARMRSELAFDVWVYGSGTADTPPPWAKFLLACSGFNQSAIAGTALTVSSTTATASSGAGPLTGVYKYKFTSVNDDTSSMSTYRDETPASASVDCASVTAKSVELANIPEASGKRIRIYRTIAGGSTYYFLTEFATGTTALTDSTLDIDLDRSRTAPTTAAEAVIYTPLKDSHDALTLHPYFHGHRRKALGGRFTFDFNWSAGEPASFTFSGRGLYQAATDTEIVADSFVDPGVPPNFCGNAPFLLPSADSTWYDDLGDGVGSASAAVLSPFAVKSISGTLGRDPILRRDASATCSVKEFILARPQPRITMVVEVMRNFKWDPIEDHRLGVSFNAGGFVVGPAVAHKRLELGFPKLRLASTPTIVVEDEQIKCWSLEFVPLQFADDGDWMRFRLY